MAQTPRSSRSNGQWTVYRSPGPRRGRHHRKQKKPAVVAALALLALVVIWPVRQLFAGGERRRKVFAVVGIVIAAAAVLLLGDYLLSRGKIHHGVEVYGISVGGMKVKEAVAKLDAAGLEAGRVELRHNDSSWVLDTRELKARIDGKLAARDAYWYTREGNYLTQAWRRFSLWFGAGDIGGVLAFDQNALKEKLDEIAHTVEQKPVSATVTMEGQTATVKPAKSGLAIDRGAVVGLLTEAALDGDSTKAKLPLRTAAPLVSTADAEAAADQARAYVGGPLTLKYKDDTWTLAADELGQYLAFIPQKADPRLKVTFDSPGTAGYFEFISGKVGKPGKDAFFKIDGTRVRVVPGTLGIGVVAGRTIANMEAAALSEGGDRVAEVVLGKVRPGLSSEEAKAMHITKRIATYTTGVSGTANRLNNVRLGAELIDDSLIAPGKVFSLNGTTGERTAAAGFKLAPVIIQGKLEDSIGGGMCQVSTTVFNAVFVAGLQIVERLNHQLYISHYPLGRDASVNYGAMDLKFRNDTKNWILLRTYFTGYALNVSLYSAPLHRKVVSTVSDWYNITAPRTERKKDPTLPVGTEVVESEGGPGQSIDCTRKVYENGKLIWNDVFKSVYMAAPRVVLVGTKPVASPSPKPSKSASPKPKVSPSP